MGFGTQLRRLTALRVSVRVIGDEADATTEKLKRVVYESRSIREELRAAKESSNAETLSVLLGNDATSGVLETYFQLLAINPNHPDIEKCKWVLRHWAKIDESLFTSIERGFKEAHTAKRGRRGQRGQKLSTDAINLILDEVTGR